MQKLFNLSDYTFIDLTHPLMPDIPQWEADNGFELSIEHDYADSTEAVKFRAQHLHTRLGVGTHMDAPAHCIAGGKTISDIPLTSLIRPCVVINVADKAHAHYVVSTDDVLAFEDKHGKISTDTFVIIYTGWSQWWSQPKKYRNNLQFPSVSPEAAALLLLRNVAGLGIDTLSPDVGHSEFLVHQLFLSAEKYLVENIAHADKLSPTGDYTFVLPPNIQNGTEAPVRLIGLKA